jgi:hypothetical protein
MTENKNDIDYEGTADIEYAAEWLGNLLEDINADECDSGETYIELRGIQYKILVTAID